MVFVAKPETKNGPESVWKCVVPGKTNTPWEGGEFPITMTFPKEYPVKPPRVMLPRGFFHPNVYPTGSICLSILRRGERVEGVDFSETNIGWGARFIG